MPKRSTAIWSVTTSPRKWPVSFRPRKHLQVRPPPKQNVGRVLRLRCHPVVPHGSQKFLPPEQRVDSHGVAVEHVHPVDTLEAIGQLLRRFGIAQTQKRVVQLQVRDTVLAHLPGQPLVAVDVHLDPEGKPRLQLHVDEAEVAVHEIVVEVQALASGIPDVRRATVPLQGKRSARLHRRQHAHQSLRNFVACGDPACHVLLPDDLPEVLVGPSGARTQVQGMSLEPGRLLEEKRLDALPANVLALEKPSHRRSAHDRQIAPKQHTVETTQSPTHPVGVLLDELVHAIDRISHDARLQQ